MKNARWIKLANDLTKGITTGEFPLHSYLPTEAELCAQYNVSRYTVRLALADLTRMGFVAGRDLVLKSSRWVLTKATRALLLQSLKSIISQVPINVKSS